jgi:hypothetical protein
MNANERTKSNLSVAGLIGDSFSEAEHHSVARNLAKYFLIELRGALAYTCFALLFLLCFV